MERNAVSFFGVLSGIGQWQQLVSEAELLRLGRGGPALNARVWKIAPLLLVSGMCALVYQCAWIRELRLVFGASTAASAAVLAIFMAGLGTGGVLLGKRADAHPKPLALYANLELLIALAAAATPALLWLTRSIYLAAGGSGALGAAGATLVRLVLSALVLALPTVAMGGTLPAAAKAAQSDGDPDRRTLALLYGANTLGAVLGVAGSTFLLLEVFGNRNTLWIACLLNAALALVARGVSRQLPKVPLSSGASSPPGAPAPLSQPPPRFVLFAAFAAGFAFLLLELVWYRMLGPLLGGSTFTFGLILMIALLGIGLGGGLYSAWGRSRTSTLSSFALVCALEAALVALPFALGDRLAVLALLLRQLGGAGFLGMVLGWSAVCSIVVLPAALVAGFQFPLLIALLGRGGHQLGRQVGLAYGWNTVGSIVGSLAGGFGLLPLLSAVGTWKLAVVLLAALAGAAVVLALRTERRLPQALGAAGLATLSLVLLAAVGPTPAWRHNPIGAGRVSVPNPTINAVQATMQLARRAIFWQVEGLESSLALTDHDGISFMVNGKSDGNAVGDAPTQVMAGLLGALLHPNPQRSLVVGLGTGSTAGWLAEVPTMKRVDVVEIEPAILEVARRCEAVNRKALDNPKVHVFLADAREALLTTRERYDVVFSEPSNPYRAGISSLYTREFYSAVKGKLAPGGIFVQWLQAYEIDAPTVRTALATLSSEFGAVEVWIGQPTDLLLVATVEPRVDDLAQIGERIRQEPYRSALLEVWHTRSVEGVFARFLAARELPQRVGELESEYLNTDDHPYIEFAFARSVGSLSTFSAAELLETARALGFHRPSVRGLLDFERVEEERLAAFHSADNPPPPRPFAAAKGDQLRAMYAAYRAGDLGGAYRAFEARPFEPASPYELLVVAETSVEGEPARAEEWVRRLSEIRPIEALALTARLQAKKGQLGAATEALEAAFVGSRSWPWAYPPLFRRALQLAPALSRRDPALGDRLFASLGQPFSASAFNHSRIAARLAVAEAVDFQRLCAEALAAVEPFAPHELQYLSSRVRCYELSAHPRLQAARDDLERFREAAPVPFANGLLP